MCEHEQRGVTLWFTGTPGSSSSSAADRMAEALKDRGYRVERLDDDLLRQTISRDLGFSREDGEEHIRRAAFVAKLLTRNDVFVVASLDSPGRETRSFVRSEVGAFLEVYTRHRGDPGHRPSNAGEEPENPEIVLNPGEETADEESQEFVPE
jgi:adenylylsulfate kinase